MADKERSPLDTAMFSVPNVSIKNINPYGIASDPELRSEYKKFLEARDKYITELEMRYQQPNWFEVAAGFLKPQLGGFGASLGSASEAMSKWQERERAMQPTIAQMRAENAMGNIALTQGLQAARIAETQAREGVTPRGAAETAGLIKGPAVVTEAYRGVFESQFQNFMSALNQQKSYLELVAQFGKQFVDELLPNILNSMPGLRPPSGYPGAPQTQPSSGVTVPGATPTTSPGSAPSAAPTAITPPPAAGPTFTGSAGVPLDPNTPQATRMAAERADIERRQNFFQETTKNLAGQADQGVKLFEGASALYKAAAKPSLKEVFGVLEKGNIASALGRALEKQNLSSVLQDVREQVTRLNLSPTQMADYQSLESALNGLQMLVQNQVINPTDARTLFEAQSMPNFRNTQDSFLRNVARLASDGLGKYELNKAFVTASKDPKFDIRDWQNSDYYRNVMKNIEKRTTSVISNPASYTPPDFMSRGLQGSQPEQRRTEGRSGSIDALREEARRRGLGG